MKITVIYYKETCMNLRHEKLDVKHNGNRAIIPNEWRADKHIVAVIEGHVNIMNSTGERIISDYLAA